MNIGGRVRDHEGYRGTIRYIGPVVIAKKAEDIWYGIEWDNLERGKHDGSISEKLQDYLRDKESLLVSIGLMEELKRRCSKGLAVVTGRPRDEL